MTRSLWRLDELFPGARYIVIRRNPYDIFRSRLAVESTAPPLRRLQLDDADPARATDRIISFYRRALETLLEERKRIPRERIVDVRFEDLERDPVSVVRAVYAALALPDFGVVEPALRRRVTALHGYQKNVHPQLPAHLRQRLADEWRPMFEAWSYPRG